MAEQHPAVDFKHHDMVEGPLSSFNQKRPQILCDVLANTLRDFSNSQSLDLLLGEALYAERQRLKREHKTIFNRARLRGDRAVWNFVQHGLLHSAAQTDRTTLLRKVVSHYAEEIGGQFDPSVYRLATRAVPWGFSWMLNAASVQRFLPWGMSESLTSRLRIGGEVTALQNLSKKGTVLLVPTHQSNIDSPLIGYIIFLMSLPPFSYGAGLNLFSNPALSFFMSNLGSYTVDRKKGNPIYKQTLKNYSTRILSEGVHSIFFPGGGRSRSGAIETKLKLGLLGTALEAQINGMKANKPQPNVYIVPLVMSYHFVLEASSLVEDFLAEAGKHRFIIMDDESWQVKKIVSFFWKFFASQSNFTARVGRPLDVFGNFVDENGKSIGPNGTTIDPARWCTTMGELCHDPQRDHEYTRRLGDSLVSSFHHGNTVLTSHAVAFAYFEALRKRYPDLDLYRFLRLSHEQRSMQLEEFMQQAEALHVQLSDMAKHGQLFLSQEMQTSDHRSWVKDGVRQLGLLHDAAVVKMSDRTIWTEDMNLLYYYRNRLSGYGLSLLANQDLGGKLGKNDRKGFLE